MAQGMSAFTSGSLVRLSRASTIPARSPGAKPVRHTSASSALVSQFTVVMPMPPRSCASTSAARL